MKNKFESKVASRLLERLANGGVDAALEYGLAVFGGNPHVTQAIILSAPEPLKSVLTAAIAARLNNRLKIRVVNNTAPTEFLSQTKNIDKSLGADLETARRIGLSSVYLAGLKATERNQSGATKQERDAAISMRKNCIRSSKVKGVLGCTDTELKRWSDDGRLPVMFRRRMPSSPAGIMLDVRHWAVQFVEDAIPNLNQWRDEDKAAKRSKRGVK